MKKRQIDRYLEIFKQASTIDSKFNPSIVTVNCTIFIGGFWTEQRINLAELESAVYGYEEHECAVWQKKYNGGDWLCYRSSDMHVTFYVDTNSIEY
ncbi:MAG: hypothetical protein J6T10_25540 [Methanobrevibacter sp.]|nr:hypothetical protein [Methanobrevibacter sp.]